MTEGKGRGICLYGFTVGGAEVEEADGGIDFFDAG